eukprot:gene10017-18648_t
MEVRLTFLNFALRRYHISIETKKYALPKQHPPMVPDSDWYPSTVKEVKLYLGVRVYMSIVNFPSFGQYLSKDIAMIKFRGRSSFEQYLPAKPTKYGIRLGMRGDRVNRYCNDIRVYPGKPTGKEPEKNLGQKGVTIDEHKHLTVRDYGEEASFVLADVSKQIVKSLELKKQKMHQYQKDSRLSPVISNKLLSADIVPVSRHSERDEDTLPCSYDYSSDNSMFSDSDSPYSASEDDDVDVNRSQDNNLCYPKRIWRSRLFQGCLPWTVLTL